MALDRPVHRSETADGTMAPAVAPTFALESTVQRDMPPPPRFLAWAGRTQFMTASRRLAPLPLLLAGLATLLWLPRTFRSHPGPQTVPSAGAAPLLRAAGLALLALALGGGFLWSAPAEAQEPAPNSPATGAATISGTMRVGETLTADVSGITDPDGLENASFSYQWIRNDGNADTYIQAAEQPTYRLEPDDEGKTIKVRVSFTDDRGNWELLTSAPTAAVQQEMPVWSADMSIVDLGNGAIGAVRGDLFSNAEGSAGLQAKWLWYYTPDRILRLAFTEIVPDLDGLTLWVGDVLLVLEAGDSNFSWEDVDVDWQDGQTLVARIARFPATASVTPTPNSPAAGAPIISGAAQAGQTLTANTSGISDADGLTNATFSYQWMANDGNTDTDIADATDSAYELSDDDVGTTVKVRVSFTDDAGNEETLTSEATAAVVARPNTLATGAPSISGAAQVGRTLTANTSGISDADGLTNATFSYQWMANDGNTDTDIADATDSAYELSDDDVGTTVKVRVSFTDDAGNEETLTSEATAAVVARPNTLATGAPSISGAAQVGRTLTANTSGISDADGLTNATFSYQWMANNGNTDTDIADATDSAYELSDDDVGTTVKIRVSFTDDAGNEETLTSEATAAVVGANECPVGGYDPTPVAVTVSAVPIEIESTTDEYFVLYVRHDLDADTTFEVPVGVTLGQDGATTLTESLEALPKERYRVEKYLVSDPADVDGDCTDDITELADPVGMNPVNPVPAMSFDDGAAAIPNRETYVLLAYKGDSGIDSHLRNLEAVKFHMVDMDTDRPSVYFMNTKTYRRHDDFQVAVGLEVNPLHGHEAMVGEMVYHPTAVAPDGSLGVYRFQFGANDVYSFEEMSYAFTVLAASMPLLEDNLAYYPMWSGALTRYYEDQSLYDDSRVDVLLAEDIAFDLEFISLNMGEGFGFLRVMSLEERPNPRDIVIYETLPNDLSRVAGIITTVPQTPLSHVNLRAVQDGVPNSFVRDALEDGDIDGLIGSYVQYLVGSSGYFLRAATPEEVDAHYKASRPSETQTPERDLTVTEITALSDIEFEDWNAFGVKAANVAVLRTLGFPDGAVPDGFAVPFYFYDEFMKHNEFYDDVEEMLADSDFQSDYDKRESELKKLRKKIKKGETPEWIIAALTEMHSKYPEGQSLRYRSSTNNEDLPGFSGAGLYDSKTQKPDETEEDGIDKSLKQVYASLWNFRAFMEREFHRVGHSAAAMGVLVHPNYTDELANGVAVSFDPFRNRYGSYYVNTQVGEDLVTNPEANSVPEELLLYPSGAYKVLAYSNRVESGELLMSDAQIDQLRRHLEVIHDAFEELYDIGDGEPFAMEIEFKITSDDVLSIKQARPWVFSDGHPLQNRPATGLPTISGIAQAGETLTADASSIADADGLSNVSYGYQWIRNDGNSDSDIQDATDTTYTLDADDVGKTIRVRVTFTDDADNNETLTSEPTAVVQQVSNGWSATMTVETRGGFTGYSYWGRPHLGSLSESEVEWDGKTHYVRYVFLKDGELWLGLNEEMFSTGFVLSVGDEEFGSAEAVVDHGGASYRFRWDDPGLGWSAGNEVTVSLVQSDQNTAALGAPTIGGAAQVGETLTADTSGVEDADGLDNVSYSYQWIRDDGNNDTDIVDATDVAYTLTDDDFGRTIQVRVSFTDDRGNAETLTSETTRAVAAARNRDATGTPTITGTPQVGQTLTADTSPIADRDGLTNVSYSHQWTAGGSDIDGATGSGYELTASDQGKTITVRVTFTDDRGNAETLTSAATVAVAAKPDTAATGLPAISGTPQVGETLTASTSAIADGDGLNNVSYRYQWISGGTDIDGATGSSYELTSSEQGQTIQVRVTFTDDRGNAETLTSAATVAVAAAPNRQATGQPTISGTPQVGQTLTADTSNISDLDGIADATFAYQWRRGGLTIIGANRSTYTLTASDQGKTITVRVRFIDDRNSIESRASNATTAVAAAPNSQATGQPTISGTPQVGQTLMADTANIAREDGLTRVSYGYQWVRNDATDDADISGATGSTYTLVAADQGRTIKVRVTFTDDAGSDESLTSAATEAVAAKPKRLTAGFDNAPDSHDGSSAFTFELRFSEEVKLSYLTLRDHGFTVAGGTVNRAKRMTQGSNIGWTMTVTPGGNAGVTVVLPVTTDCDAQGAVCTADGRKLSNRLEFIVSGPGQGG